VDVAIQNINALLVVMRDAVKDANVPGLSDNVNHLLADLRKTNEHLNEIMASKDAREALKNLGQTLANLKTGTENLPQTIADLRKLLREVNTLVASQRDEVQGLLQQSKQVFENLNDLTGDAKRNPSRLFFGAPPAKTNPEKK